MSLETKELYSLLIPLQGERLLVPRMCVAEVIAFADFVACRGEHGAKEQGKMRLEGKEYVVKDGDVMHFRFNV